jgi:hypothetical protein
MTGVKRNLGSAQHTPFTPPIEIECRDDDCSISSLSDSENEREKKVRTTAISALHRKTSVSRASASPTTDLHGIKHSFYDKFNRAYYHFINRRDASSMRHMIYGAYAVSPQDICSISRHWSREDPKKDAKMNPFGTVNYKEFHGVDDVINYFQVMFDTMPNIVAKVTRTSVTDLPSSTGQRAGVALKTSKSKRSKVSNQQPSSNTNSTVWHSRGGKKVVSQFVLQATAIVPLSTKALEISEGIPGQEVAFQSGVFSKAYEFKDPRSKALNNISNDALLGDAAAATKGQKTDPAAATVLGEKQESLIGRLPAATGDSDAYKRSVEVTDVPVQTVSSTTSAESTIVNTVVGPHLRMAPSSGSSVSAPGTVSSLCAAVAPKKVLEVMGSIEGYLISWFDANDKVYRIEMHYFSSSNALAKKNQTE